MLQLYQEILQLQMNMQLHKQQQLQQQQVVVPQNFNMHTATSSHQQPRIPSPQQKSSQSRGHTNAYYHQIDNDQGQVQQKLAQQSKPLASYPNGGGRDTLNYQQFEGSAVGKLSQTLGGADIPTESIDDAQHSVNPFHVAQMNVIGGGSGSSEFLPFEGQIKKNDTQSKGKGGSIIVVNQQTLQVVDNQQDNHLKMKTLKKTTASQNKFDIKAIVAQAQDGCPSRKTQSHDRSHPSNNSAAPTIGGGGGAGSSMMILGGGGMHPIIAKHMDTSSTTVVGGLKSQSNELRTNNKSNGSAANTTTAQAVVQQNAQGGSGSGNLFSSFFSQPKEHYEFLTKTLGCTPTGGGSNINNIAAVGSGASQNTSQLIKASSTVKQTQKKGNQLLSDNPAANVLSVIKNDSIIKSGQNDFHQYPVQSSKQLSNSKINSNQINKKAVQNNNLNGPSQNQLIIYKSFQQPPSSQTQGNKIIQIQNHQQLNQQQQQQQQFLSNTLQTFTQNYYGAQHKKKQNLQKKAAPQGYHRREISEAQTLKTSLAQLQPPPTQSGNTLQNQSSRQLKFGQIMEELERFSLSTNTNNNNNNFGRQQFASGEIAMQDLLIGEEQSSSWAVESHVSIAQSSICESDLEYTQLGNIRASTYKRTVDNQETRKRLMKYKSEERKKEPSFFTKEYMDNRYINDRVEMELKDFKAEIEKKFEGSKLCDFKFPRIVLKTSASTTRPNRQIKALAPNHHPHLYQQHQSRGYSAEDDPLLGNQQPQRITLGGKNVIFKTTTATQQQQHSKPSSSQVKHKNISILEEFPVEIIKTQDMRQQQQQQQNLLMNANQNINDMHSFNESMNDMMNFMSQGGSQIPQNLITQDSIHYVDGDAKKNKKNHQHSNSQKASNGQVNVLLQNFFVKQSFDHRTTAAQQQKAQLNPTLSGNMTQSTTKKSNKLVNNSQDNIIAHHFNTFDANEQQRSKGNQTVLLHKFNNQGGTHPDSVQQENIKKSNLQQQKQTPKNYSLQLNQVVKKILNDSGEAGSAVQTLSKGNGAPHTVVHMSGKVASGLNSTSFDNNMLYEPSFYTTESYKQGHIKKQGNSNEPRYAHHHSNMMVVGPGQAGVTGLQDNDGTDQIMLQSYTTVGEQKRGMGGAASTSTKKQLKVKRSDSNGSNSQPKNSLLNKIYRSNKTIKSPQSRQSNMNLNNQNALNNHAVIQGRGGEILRIAKPSQTVNQSNINSTLSSVRQLHIIQKQQPISHSRQGSSGIRQQQNLAKSTGKTNQTTRLPSSTGKKHQHNLSHVPSSSLNQIHLSGCASNMFQTDTGASFHNYPNQNSNRVAGASSKDKKGASNNHQPNSFMIKSSQIKRSSGERSNREQKGMITTGSKTINNGSTQQKILLDPQQQQQFAVIQKSFQNQGQQLNNTNALQNNLNLIVHNQNNNLSVGTMFVQTASSGMKGSVASSPNQRQNSKKSQSLTSKNTQRATTTGQSQGKLVNLGILNQISNPLTNGKGGKITYRNNYQRINTNTNSNSHLVPNIIQGGVGVVGLSNSSGITGNEVSGMPIQLVNCLNNPSSTQQQQHNQHQKTSSITGQSLKAASSADRSSLKMMTGIHHHQPQASQTIDTISKVKKVVSIANAPNNQAQQ